MKRWSAALILAAVVVTLAFVRETEARILRRRACRPCPTVCQPCCPAVCVPSAGEVAMTPVPAPQPESLATPPAPVPIPPLVPVPSAGNVVLLLLVDDGNKDTGAANVAGAALVE